MRGLSLFDAMEAVGNTLQRRKERQRRHIIEVAQELIRENGGDEAGGIEATTVEMISARADISTRTFFRYFESKLDVIYLDHRRSVADLLGLVRARLAHEPVERAVIQASVDQVLAFTDDPLNRERLLRALRSPAYATRLAVWRFATRQQLVELLAGQPGRGSDRTFVHRAVVSLARTVIDNTLERWARDPRQDVRKLLDGFITSTPQVAHALAAAAVSRPRRRRAAKPAAVTAPQQAAP